jgi:hypothetical protein
MKPPINKIIFVVASRIRSIQTRTIKMRSLLTPILLLALVSCNSENKNQPETSTASLERQPVPDFNVALNFINDYAKFCTTPNQGSATSDWIRQDSLLTDSFKNRYNSLLDSAQKKDPELGLDSDPIFDAQDFPEKGFSILKIDTLNRYVTVAGNDWKEFELVLKLKQENEKWLVDGAGVINIPPDKRAKR